MTEETVNVIVEEFKNSVKSLADMTEEERKAWVESLANLREGEK